MTSPLQKSPDGVLGALDLKVLGLNPNKFSDTLVPIVDVYDQYLANELATLESPTATITGPAVSADATLTVPNGQAYRVLAIGVYCLLAGGDAALTQVTQFVIVPRNGFSMPVLRSGTVGPATTGGTSRIWGELLARPLYLNSGCRIIASLGLSAAPGTPTNFTTRALVEVIQT